jgi:hypothetical protein
MPELREFVYLDDESLNSNLSSLGRGLPSQIIQSTEDEVEKGADAGGKIFGVGASARYGDIDRSAIETTLQVTLPYRFQDFLDTLDDEGVEIYENPDPRATQRGDVVRVEGKVKPMSLLKLEIAIQTLGDFFSEDTLQAFEGVDAADDVSEIREAPIDHISQLLKTFTGERLPVQIESDGDQFAVSLDREKMRIDPAEALVDEQEFVIIGRVESKILRSQSWDPLVATSIIERYFPDEAEEMDIQEEVRELAREMNIEMEDSDWQLSGPTALIQPIAMFW